MRAKLVKNTTIINLRANEMARTERERERKEREHRRIG